MSETISIILPAAVVADVEAFARADGIARDELLRRAVEAYLREQRFVALRSRVVPQARHAGFFTDEDVFSTVS